MFRLLNKSIIRVEQPDVALDEEEEEAGREEQEEEGAAEPMEQDGEQPKVKKWINYEEYKKMSFLLIKYIQSKELEAEQTEGGEIIDIYR